jgi:hypothetical protein
MSNLELCEAALRQIAADIIQDQEDKNIRASGASAQSIDVSMNDTGGDLVGASYIYFQIYGRRPGKYPPLTTIQEWIKVKGISLEKISIKSLAYLIARKIATAGTRIFQKMSEGLAVDNILAENSDKLADQIGDNVVDDILDAFTPLQKS